jgi:cytochrome bd-type quinol oxidase subunit 2
MEEVMANEANDPVPPNGAAAAATLGAAFGVFMLGVCALAGDASTAVSHVLNVWNPTGPLSGVTAIAIVTWLAAWFFLGRAWRARNLDFRHINRLALTLVIAGMLLTFPPIMDLLQGK